MAQPISYEFDVSDEYLFYPAPLSRQASFDKLVSAPTKDTKDKVKLFDPNVRKQLQQLRPHYPWFMIFVTVLQVGLMAYSMILNLQTTGSLIQMNPFNYMIGPESGTLIYIGARYIPCMKPGTGFDAPNASFACPIGISGTAKNGTACYLRDVCRFGGLSNGAPDQWWRFITACFLHGGLLHLLMNLSFQIQGGFDLEKDMGWWRMALIYLISGVGGFMFGASLSDIRNASVGASGSLYGLIACLLLDLIQNWSLIKRPWIELLKMSINIIFSLMIGTLPYVDNLAHVGGFLFGLLSGILLMPKIYFSKWDKRRKLALMIIALPALLFCFYIFGRSFVEGNNFCTFCKYFNCIPGMPWCDAKFSTTTYVNVTSGVSRAAFRDWGNPKDYL